MEDPALKNEHQTSMRAWQRSAPWLRRFSMRMGLQGKLLLCFMAVLCSALAVTCWVFERETHDRLADIMGEQARQVATALSLNSGQSIQTGDWRELKRRGQELIKSRNILFVGYLDDTSRPRALSSRDLDFRLHDLKFDQQSLMQVRAKESATFGEYLEVVAPIFSLPAPTADLDETADNNAQLLGYVAVGVSQQSEEAQINRVQYIVIGMACVMIIFTLPVAYIIVHRIFLPIRKLVAVTKQITSGDLDARVEIHRPDVIGELARSFDNMVMRVKQQQEALADANHDLERKVEQRTAQLESANNRLSNEIAEKEEFLRAVSHDLNAPLRNISGMATMLLMKYRDQFDEDIVHRLERIKSNVDVETDLITELLELSRIKTRRQKMEQVDIELMIEDLQNMFESDLRNKMVNLIVDTPLPKLNAERVRIRQIFQNLIDNAIKYMGNALRREIHVGCLVREDEAEFFVRDTGLGIDDEDIEKVFLVFRRGKNLAAQNVAGKGVGLASVKSIVETYDGKIWVTSVPGQGSTFRFTINGKFVPQCATVLSAA